MLTALVAVGVWVGACVVIAVAILGWYSWEGFWARRRGRRYASAR
jgi:hypothetical protein